VQRNALERLGTNGDVYDLHAIDVTPAAFAVARA